MPEKMRPVLFNPNERIRFHAGAQIDGEICLVGGLDDLPVFESYNRIYSYKPDRADPWLYTEVETYIRSVISGRFKDGGPEFFVLASQDADIWALGPPGKGFSEIIPDAGYYYDGEHRGDITAVNWIGQSLYAVGLRGQVYRRRALTGAWELVSESILGQPFDVEGITGASDNDLYILRTPDISVEQYRPLDMRGQIMHSSGGEWRLLWDGPTSATVGPLLMPDGDVVVAGCDGIVIKGNKDKGFEVYSRGVLGSAGAVSIACVDSEIFTTSGRLATVKMGHTTWVETELAPKMESSVYLSVRGADLLSVGYHDITRRRGGVWERIHFPGNEPITANTRW